MAFKRIDEKAGSRRVDYPEFGHPVAEFPDTDDRQVIVKPYRFFYKIQGEIIWVVGGWHAAQLLKTLCQVVQITI